ncbi:MAG: hypothetical protein AB7O26_13005 [Planctomycetaceae bacterium]
MSCRTTSAGRVSHWAITLSVATLLIANGCGTLNGTGVASLDGFTREKGTIREEDTQRRRFVEERDPEAMRWLLANRVRTSMTIEDVNEVFGEPGVREYGDRWIKKSNGLYHEGDVIYKWGPDNEGQTIYLAFRDGHLVNFEPEDYKK